MLFSVYGHPSQMQIFGKWEIIVINIVIMKDHKISSQIVKRFIFVCSLSQNDHFGITICFSWV